MSKLATLAPQGGVEASSKSPSRTGLLRGQSTPAISGNSLKKSFKEVLEGQLRRQEEMPQTQKTLKSEVPSTVKRSGLSPKPPRETRTGLSPEFQFDKKPTERQPNTMSPQSGLEIMVDHRATPLEHHQNQTTLRSTSLRPSRVTEKVNEQRNSTFFAGFEPKSTNQNTINGDALREKAKLTVVDRRQVNQRPNNGSLLDQKVFDPGLKNAPHNEVLTDRPLAGTNHEGGVVWARVETPVTRQGPSQAVVQTRTVQVPPAFYQQLHSEFLDRAKLILKDGGGEMRLTLRPQNLGSLRLSVSLEERVLKGQIVVDNETVRTLVESQLDSLLRSFREDGFTPLELRVSVAGEEGGGNNRQEARQQHSQSSHSSNPETFHEKFEQLNHVELEA